LISVGRRRILFEGMELVAREGLGEDQVVIQRSSPDQKLEWIEDSLVCSRRRVPVRTYAW
jgi:hypothetical protein